MEDKQQRLQEIESRMNDPAFWDDKEQAQELVKEYNELKAALAGAEKLDTRNAIITIYAGAGGADAEDFAGMLYRMYCKYAEQMGWTIMLRHQNENDHDGFRNVTFEVDGKHAYGTLKHEAGVHRLVRISPFNAKQQRHTSFAMVEVIPKLPKAGGIELNEADLDISFARSSGPGGQNVNKRETAVRIVHAPTGLSVHVDSERTQQANREQALEILKGKLYRKQEADRRRAEQGLSVSKTTDAEWGSQIRSYVLHPYTLVKDHRTNTEVRDVTSVLAGNIGEFIKAEQDLD